MSRVALTIKCGIATSVDGFVAGPNQSADRPVGEGVDDQLHKVDVRRAGAARCRTRVTEQHPRDPLPMEGGTTFTFVTGGINAALQVAKEAAGDGDIAIAGGAETINQYLAAGLLDEIWLHIAPVTLGAGERLFDGVPPLTLEPLESRATKLVTHVRYRINE